MQSEQTLEAIHSRGLREIARRIFARRVLFAPIGIAYMGTLFAVDATSWRRLGLAAVALVMLTYASIEALRSRRGTVGDRALPWNFAFMVVGQLAGVTFSGGLDSPAIPPLIALAIASSLLLERRVAITLVTIQATWMLALAALQTSALVGDAVPRVFGAGPYLGTPALVWTRAFLLALLAVVGFSVGRLVRTGFLRMAEEALAARESARRAHEGELRDLMTMAAELAHELKNPLASIKGLSAMIATEVEGREGKAPERLAVLRREADRMQATLEELMSFSRPLVPLEKSEVDLGGVVASAAALCEGLASAKDLTVSVRSEAAPIVCDPRKIEQVLLNLLQNAIEASPRGAAIGVEVVEGNAGGTACVIVRVRDAGPGLAPEVARSLFRPGVTTKESGHGLGLAVSRAIAQQHGGELTLETSPSGVSAALSLPRSVEEVSA
jgi:signal transduction histidine kinase